MWDMQPGIHQLLPTSYHTVDIGRVSLVNDPLSLGVQVRSLTATGIVFASRANITVALGVLPSPRVSSLKENRNSIKGCRNITAPLTNM